MVGEAAKPGPEETDRAKPGYVQLSDSNFCTIPPCGCANLRMGCFARVVVDLRTRYGILAPTVGDVVTIISHDCDDNRWSIRCDNSALFAVPHYCLGDFAFSNNPAKPLAPEARRDAQEPRIARQLTDEEKECVAEINDYFAKYLGTGGPEPQGVLISSEISIPVDRGASPLMVTKELIDSTGEQLRKDRDAMDQAFVSSSVPPCLRG